MTGCGDIAEEDADLAVLHACGDATILSCDASGVAAAFGKAAFIQDEHGEKRLGVCVGRSNGKQLQRLDEEAAQFIAYPLLVPDCVGEQALDAVGMEEAGVFSDLPAIFPGNLAEDGVQVEQGVVAWFGTREVAGQALMELAQGEGPGADFTQGWPGWRECGMVRWLHGVLVS